MDEKTKTENGDKNTKTSANEKQSVKVDDLSKEDLIKQNKKQLILLQKLKSKCDELNKKNNEQQKELSIKDQELSSYIEQQTNLQNLHAALKDSVSSLEENNSKYLREQREISDQVECMKMKEKSLTSVVKQLQVELEKISNENQILKRDNEVASVETEALKSTAEEFEKFKNEANLWKQDCELHKKERDEFKRNLEDLLKENEAAAKESALKLEALNGRVQLLEGAENSLKDALIEKQKEIDNLTTELESKGFLQQKMERIETENKTLQRNFEDAVNQVHELKDNITQHKQKSLIASNTAVDMEFKTEDDLDNTNTYTYDDDQECEAHNLFQRVRLLEAELQNAFTERDQLLFREEREQQDCTHLQDSISRLEAEVEDLKSKLESSEFEKDELRTKLEEADLDSVDGKSRWESLLNHQEVQTDFDGALPQTKPSVQHVALLTEDDKNVLAFQKKINEECTDASNADLYDLFDRSLTNCLIRNEDLVSSDDQKAARKQLIQEISTLVGYGEIDQDNALEKWLKSVKESFLQLSRDREDLFSLKLSQVNEVVEMEKKWQHEVCERKQSERLVSSLEEQVRLLMSTQEAMIVEKQTLESEFESLKQMDLKHEEELFACSSEMKNLEESLIRKSEEFDRVEKSLQLSNKERGAEHEAICILEGEKSAWEERLRTLNEELFSVKDQMASLIEKNEELGLFKERLETANAEIALLKQTILKSSDDSNESNKKMKDLEKMLEILSEEHSALKQEQIVREEESLEVLEVLQSFNDVPVIAKNKMLIDDDTEVVDSFVDKRPSSKLMEIANVLTGLKTKLINISEAHEKCSMDVQSDFKTCQTDPVVDDHDGEIQRKIFELEKDGEEKDIEIERLGQNLSAITAEKDELLTRPTSSEFMQLSDDLKVLQNKLEELNALYEETKQENQTHKLSLEENLFNLATARSQAANSRAQNEQLEVDVGNLRGDKEMLASQLSGLNGKVESLKNEVETERAKCAKLESELKEMVDHLDVVKRQLQQEKENHATSKRQIDQLLQEAKRNNLMNLEFADYERLVSDLNQQLEAKNEKVKKAEEELQHEKSNASDIRIQLEQAEVQFEQAECRGNKMKLLLVKTRKELGEAKTHEAELNTILSKTRGEVELRKATEELLKVENADLLSKNQKMQENIRITKESHQRTLQALEGQVNTLKSQLENQNSEFKKCQADYENYKVRVHSVLKQQKIKNSHTPQLEFDSKEIECLEKVIEQLRTKLQETDDQLVATSTENKILQEEHDRLLQINTQLMEDLHDKQKMWNERLNELNTNTKDRVKHYQDTVDSLQNQIEAIKTTYSEQLQRLKTDHEEALQLERTHILTLESELLRLQQEQQKNSPTKELEMFDITNIERQEGEGSENTEPLSGTKLHLDSVSSVVSFEQLLSGETKSNSSQVATPQQDPETLEGQLAVTVKKLQHLTEVLNESEASNIRLAEQTRLLKEEIRRLERNKERQQHADNLEYLKNIVLKFLMLQRDEREHLIPVLTMMLRLSPEERSLLTATTTGEASEKSESDNAAWSNYLPRWSGLV